MGRTVGARGALASVYALDAIGAYPLTVSLAAPLLLTSRRSVTSDIIVASYISYRFFQRVNRNRSTGRWPIRKFSASAYVRGEIL